MKNNIYAARIRYNANTRGASVGDCVKRSLTIAYSMDYDQVAAELNRINRNSYHFEEGYSKEPVFRKFIEARGDHFQAIHGDLPTVEEFCEQHPSGVYLLLVSKSKATNTSHMVAVVNGDYYDSWGSGNWYVQRYAVVKSGKSDTYEIDYEACLSELSSFEQAYVEELQKKCPDCMHLSIRSVTQDRYEPDTGTITLKCLYGSKEELPSALRWYADRYAGHQIVIKFNPRLSREENIATLQKKLKQKTYDWVYTLRKEIQDNFAAEKLQPHPDFVGSKIDLMNVPEWARPHITDFYDNGSDYYGARFDVAMEALPGDPRAKVSPIVLFRSDTLRELKKHLEWYKNDFIRFDYDY